ncbi:MAG: hypothetical protein CUN55_11580 [Phototrophicales bacterium]|nr:MAG: hypothetical protein CUN55_11580 [Phototrophicales bacterium]
MEGPMPYLILAIVVFFVFIEQLLVFSFFSPGSWSVIFASFLAFAGFIPIPLLILGTFLGAFLGTYLQYYLGYRHGERFLRFVNRFPRIVDLEQMKQTQVNFWLVILSYNLPQIRGIVPFMAGVSKMPKTQWLIASAIGVVSWLACFIGMGMGAAWMFEGDFQKALHWIWEINSNSVLATIFWGGTIAFIIYVVYKWRLPSKTTQNNQ